MPKNNWLIFRMGEVNTWMSILQRFVSHARLKRTQIPKVPIAKNLDFPFSKFS